VKEGNKEKADYQAAAQRPEIDVIRTGEVRDQLDLQSFYDPILTDVWSQLAIKRIIFADRRMLQHRVWCHPKHSATDHPVPYQPRRN